MHIRKMPSGHYRAIVQHNGRKATGTAPTKLEATILGAQLLADLGGTADRTGMTVAELVASWLHENTAKWSPTYAVDIEAVVVRIPATFMNRTVSDVRPPIVAALYRQLEQDGWSPHRVGRVHNILNGSWKLAVRYGWAPENPCRDLSAPEISRPDVRPPDHDTVARLLEAAGPELALVFRLAAITGARLGELVALRWADVDGDTLTIRRAAVWTSKTKLVVRDTTKTGRKGDRRLVLDDATLMALTCHHDAMTAMAEGNKLPDPVYIFSHDAGLTPWRPQYVGLAFRRIRDRLELSVRFHDIRHYVATTMLQDGEAPIDVAAQLGHSTPATTLRVYAAYMPGRGRESASRRASRLPPTGQHTKNHP